MKKFATNFDEFQKQFLIYKKDVSEFAKNNPAENRLDYFRAVSFNNFIKNSKRISREERKIAKRLLERFPKMGSFSSDRDDNIRYEPILNRNLLKINFDYLERLAKILHNSENESPAENELQKLAEEELAILQNRIKKIDEDLSNVPEILSKNLKPLVKKNISKKPRLSVITASYNLAPLVEETMRSITNQDSEEFEHIVIDGASKDGSLELLKKYPNIILVSEKDKGYPDAFFKGIQKARGDYILQCCVSDGYARVEWLRRCLEELDKNKDVSLVWGLPGRLSEDSKFTGISRAEFHYSEAPQKEKMFNYCMKEFFFYTEGNLCVSRKALLKCFPTAEECNKKTFDFWIEFSHRFNSLGYLSLHIPMLANFGRIHGNQIGQKWIGSGINERNIKDYKRKVARYKWRLVLGLAKHTFIDKDGNKLPIEWKRAEFIKEYLGWKMSFVFWKIKHYLKPRTYTEFIKRKLRRN